jgi:hypothetical protein
MRFITIYPAALLAAIATAAVADYPLSYDEQHRLAVFCSYVVATHEGIVGPDGGGGSTYKAGDTCPECRGAGEVGDGVVMMKCIYNEDGLYCKNGKLAAVGSANDSFGEDCTPERDKFEKCMECREKGFNEPQIRALGEQLLKAMEEARAKEQPPASDKPQPQPEPEQQPPPASTPQNAQAKPLTEFRQTDWNWQGVGNPPLSVKRQHLIQTHKVDAKSVNKMSNAEVEALHNLLHNSEVRAAAPSKSSASSSCPGGNCPTSSAGRSGGCPGGNCPTSGSRGYSRRGFFGRFR